MKERLTKRNIYNELVVSGTYDSVHDKLWDMAQRLAEYEDMIDQSKLVEITCCSECKHQENCEEIVLLSSCYGEVERTEGIDYCSYGERRE